MGRKGKEKMEREKKVRSPLKKKKEKPMVSPPPPVKYLGYMGFMKCELFSMRSMRIKLIFFFLSVDAFAGDFQFFFNTPAKFFIDFCQI